jgi:hypothetical protein
MSLAEYASPAEPARLPRRGDPVIKPRHLRQDASDCISGLVTGYGHDRLSVVLTSTKQVVHMEMSRFTWSRKRQAWVCWPKEVVREMRNLERLDTQATVRRAHGTALVGDFVMLGKKVGWIGKLVVGGDKVHTGMIFHSLKGYRVSTPVGVVVLASDSVIYDPARRVWSARA